ncbi:hypothetical protein N9R79_11950 [Vibrio sp.]|nr:hypothetical protein [Vibrio sp.]
MSDVVEVYFNRLKEGYRHLLIQYLFNSDHNNVSREDAIKRLHKKALEIGVTDKNTLTVEFVERKAFANKMVKTTPFWLALSAYHLLLEDDAWEPNKPEHMFSMISVFIKISGKELDFEYVRLLNVIPEKLETELGIKFLKQALEILKRI